MSQLAKSRLRSPNLKSGSIWNGCCTTTTTARWGQRTRPFAPDRQGNSIVPTHQIAQEPATDHQTMHLHALIACKCPSPSLFEHPSVFWSEDTHTTGATLAVDAKPAASPKMAGVRPGEWMASKTMDYHCCSPFTQNDVWLEAVSLTWLGAGDVLAGSRCSFSDCSCSHSIA